MAIIASNYVKVTVGNQVFEIPSDKVQEVFSLLSRLQSISIHSENNPSPVLSYQGKSLICG